ncbi:hsdR [Cronobacter turicensis]
MQALINNGLDFLEKAREELEASRPKFSIVSFWTAVEILLKVPLVHEHWTLVCSGKKIVKKKYLEGDFQSVTYDETCMRLGEVLEKPLTKETMTVFDKVRKHRNRVVHFYHNAFSDLALKDILAEQADAWFALNRLMRGDWASLLGPDLQRKLAQDETRMLSSSQFYAGAKFRHIEPVIMQFIKEGKTVTACTSCGQNAAVVKAVHGKKAHTLCETHCHVCFRGDTYMEVHCPHCNSLERLEPMEGTSWDCSGCRKPFDKFKIINEWQGRPEDYSLAAVPANCSDCEGYETVCEFGGSYLCVSCLTMHSSLESCDYCGSKCTSVDELSIIYGCDFCSGATGWDE